MVADGGELGGGMASAEHVLQELMTNPISCYGRQFGWPNLSTSTATDGPTSALFARISL